MEPRVWHRSYDPGVPPSLSYEPVTLPQLLDQAAARYARAPAVLFHNCRLTYGELKEAVNRLANALASLGVGPGTRVAALLGLVLAAVSLAAGQAPPSTDIYLAELRARGPRDRVEIGAPVNATHRTGYDNQPFFTPDGRGFLYTSVTDGQADIWRYNIAAGRGIPVTTTPESEYSATPLPDGSGFSVVRVEADSTQRLWRFDWDGGHPTLILPSVKPVGYHAWGDAQTLALFVLGQPATLQVADLRAGTATPVARDIGRGVQRIPGVDPPAISFVQKSAPPDSSWSVAELDLATRRIRTLVRTLPGVDQYAWTPAGVLLMAKGAKLYQWSPSRSPDWEEVADFSALGIENITRLAVSRRGDRLALVAADRTP